MLRHWPVVLVLAALSSAGVSPRLLAQDTHALRGTVVSAEGETPLDGAAVVAISPAARHSTQTTASGTFALRVPHQALVLVAARIGFRPETLDVAPADSLVRVRLTRAPLALSPVLVEADRGYTVASSRAVRDLDIMLRPRESSQELLRLIPGLVIAQHAGGGKAEQIFLRGFDADHGTDVALSVDGSPVNMVSHGHGQGYSDLHFLLPEIIERIDVRKGPYDARDGDFATAGAVTFETRDRIPDPVVAARWGSFGAGRALAMIPFGGDASESGGYLAAAVQTSDGHFDAPLGYRRLNAMGKVTAPLGSGAELVVTSSAFDARWDQSGQVPRRAVTARTISRFGSIDPSEGGSTARYDASIGLRSRAGEGEWDARLFASRYRFRLYSNFTFFLADSVNGDGIEQVDDRSVVGAQATYSRASDLVGRPGRWFLGVGNRADFADVALFGQRLRRRLDRRVHAHIEQASFFGWASRDIELTPALRLQLGVRGDLFRFDVDDRLDGDAPSEAGQIVHASGRRWQGIVSPKANLALEITPATVAYVNAGSGFHSNDARDVIQSRHKARVLPRARGAELGLRHSWDRGSVAAALWGLDLESELVYVGDEGITEPNGRTRRTGVDLEGRVQLARWLWADADVNLSRGRFRDGPPGADRIPLAPRVTSTGGLTVRDVVSVEGGIRYRLIGARPASEDGSVTASGYTVWEVFAGWHGERASVFGAIDNLFDVQWNEAQFATESRLLGESAPVTELHFTPGAPRAIQLGIAYRF